MAELVETIPGREVSARPAGAVAATARPARLARVRAWPAVRKFVLALSVLYVAKQVILVLLFPPFTGHDEVAHYSYLRVVATEGRVPVLPDLEEWRAGMAAENSPAVDRLPDELYRYCDYTTDDWWCERKYADDPPDSVTLSGDLYPSGWIYTANHPPLYYILMTPVYWLSAGSSPETQQYLLRFAVIPFGLATVWLAYALSRIVFPRDGFLAVTVPAFVAFQPQISYEAAMVNNDILGIAIVGAILCLLAAGIRDRFPTGLCALLGVAFGIALLSKGTSMTIAPVIGLAVLVSVGPRDVRGLLRRGAIIGGCAAVLAAPWYLFLYRQYGDLSSLELINRLQYWNRPNGTFFGQLFNRGFAADRFNETWGQFGWRLIPLDAPLLWAIGLPLVVALGGLVQYALTANRGISASMNDPVLRPARWQVLALGMLFVTCLVAYLAVIQFGTQFALTQARYYFPAINAAALLLMLGLRTLIPLRFHGYGRAAVLAALVALNLVIATQYVIPFWHEL
jgi:4-amino-4-deoxy-L-arabinose transferase-like glycosyltransferase